MKIHTKLALAALLLAGSAQAQQAAKSKAATPHYFVVSVYNDNSPMKAEDTEGLKAIESAGVGVSMVKWNNVQDLTRVLKSQNNKGTVTLKAGKPVFQVANKSVVMNGGKASLLFKDDRLVSVCDKGNCASDFVKTIKGQ